MSKFCSHVAIAHVTSWWASNDVSEIVQWGGGGGGGGEYYFHSECTQTVRYHRATCTAWE